MIRKLATLFDCGEGGRKMTSDMVKDRIDGVHALGCKKSVTVRSLFPFQREGVQFLRSHRRAVLADEMGLGKSAQAACALAYFSDSPTLIFAPASLCLNWLEEIRMWTGLRAEFHPASSPFRFPRIGEIIVRTYNSLPQSYVPEDHYKPRLWPTLYPVPKDLTLIFDEAHYLKSPQSQRSGSARALAERAERVWCLTGTPLLNRPPELWALGQALGFAARDIFGRWEGFVRMFGGKSKGKWGGYTWTGATNEAKARLGRVMLRRRRIEVMPELPRKTYRDIQLPIGKEIDVPKAKAWDDERVERECRPPIGELSSIRAKLAALKVDAATEIAFDFAQAEEPLIIFSAHRVLLTVRDKLGERGVKCGLILGETTKEDRAAQVKRFQAGELSMLAGTIGAMGTGLTLTKACHALFIDLDWVPANNAQAEDRICRIGQTRPVVIHRLISQSPIDKRVWGVLAKKAKLVASLDA